MKNLSSILLSLALVASCGGDADTDAATDTETGSESEGTTGGDPLAEYVLGDVPKDAVEVNELRGLDPGATVTVRGDIKEHSAPAGYAIFELTDHGLLSCDEKEGNMCPTPWDFCCEEPMAMKLGTAAVEFHDGDGEIMEAAIKGWQGIDYLSNVVVTGTLQKDDVGNITVVASGLFVEAHHVKREIDANYDGE